MSRSGPGVRLLVLLAAACAAAAGEARAADGKLNLVFILADDLGWADLACYGADLHETPNLDRLARQGLRFTDAHAAAPVCSPTRASIMTGKAPARLHMTTWYESAQSGPDRNRRMLTPKVAADLPLAEETLAEVLHAAGYITAHVGKWHLGDAAHYPEAQGFDVNIGGTFWGAPATFFFPYRGPFGAAKELRYVPHLEWGAAGEYLTDRLTDEALRVIDRAGDRPFYLNLAYHSVHTPTEGKPALVERYRRKLAPGLHHQNPAYAAMVHSLDENVGRVLARLDERGLAERTVVVFTSDNGGYIGRFGGMPVTSNHPLRSGKGSLYEGGLRVPLIVRWPGVTQPGAECAEPVVSTDLNATLRGLAGRPAADGPGDGLSLAPLLKDPRGQLDRDALFFHYPHYYATTTPASAVRLGAWKLIEYFEDGRVELYDLSRDLGEQHDLARAKPEQAGRLHDRLRLWQREVGAQLPAANAHPQPRAAN